MVCQRWRTKCKISFLCQSAVLCYHTLIGKKYIYFFTYCRLFLPIVVMTVLEKKSEFPKLQFDSMILAFRNGDKPWPFTFSTSFMNFSRSSSEKRNHQTNVSMITVQKLQSENRKASCLHFCNAIYEKNFSVCKFVYLNTYDVRVFLLKPFTSVPEIVF